MKKSKTIPNRRLHRLWAALLLCCLVASPVFGSATQPDTTVQPEETGAPAAGYETIGYMGLLNLIGQNKGKVVLVNFWATWCGPCKKEIPALKSLRESYDQDQLALFGVSVDDTEEPLQAFLEQTSFNYPMYFAARDVAPVFQVGDIPHLLFYDKDGLLVLNHKGYISESDLNRIVDELLQG